MTIRIMALPSTVLVSSVAILAGCGNSIQPSAAKTTTGGAAVVALAPQTSLNWFFPDLSAAAFSDVNTQVDSMMSRLLIVFNQEDQVDYSRSLVSSITYNSIGMRCVLTVSPKY